MRHSDGQTSIVYNAGTGEVAVDAPAGKELTSVNIESAVGHLHRRAPAQNLGGSFDNDTDNNIFKATFGGSFGSLSFGNVAQPGLSAGLCGGRSDRGRIAGRWRSLGNVDLIYVPVPEPSSVVLLSLSLLGIPLARRAVSGPAAARSKPHKDTKSDVCNLKRDDLRTHVNKEELMRHKRFRPIVERLEQRQLLSASTWFEDSGQGLGTNTLGVEFGDLDADGDLDVFAGCGNWPGGPRLFRNAGLAEQWQRTVFQGLERQERRVLPRRTG